MTVSKIIKHPSETYPIGVSYAVAAPPGATLLSGQWSAINAKTGLDASTDVLQAAPAVIDGQVAKCRVLGGLVDQAYQLSITATFDTGDVLHDNIMMFVTEDG